MYQLRLVQFLLKYTRNKMTYQYISNAGGVAVYFFLSFYTVILFEPVFQPASLSHGSGTEETPLVVLKKIDEIILDSYGIRSSCTFPSK